MVNWRKTMGIGGDDFYNPIMYQDLATASMQPMPVMPGSFYNGGATNMLGGVTMSGQLDNDRFQKMQDKEKKDFSLLKKVGLGILAIGALALINFKGIGKTIGKGFKSVGSVIAKPFKAVGNWFKKSP